MKFCKYYSRILSCKIYVNSIGAHKCVIPKVKLVFGSKGFYVRGPQVFNSLPLRIREENVFRKFRKRVIDHFNNP